MYFNLADDLAASGYVVAAPTYPLSNGFAGGDSEQAAIVVASTVDFFDFHLKGDDAAIERLQDDADVPGVSTLQVEE